MKYGSRKFMLALLTIVSADVLLCLGSLTPTVWAAAVGSALALYMAGNVGHKAITKPE